MELQKQVTSREISQRIAELGVKQESLFYWYKDAVDIDEWQYTLGIRDEQRLCLIGYDFANVSGREDFFNKVQGNDDFYSAFTVAELGEMLPRSVSTKPNTSVSSRWECWVHTDELKVQYGETEADARGKMLIYLLENKLITL